MIVRKNKKNIRPLLSRICEKSDSQKGDRKGQQDSRTGSRQRKLFHPDEPCDALEHVKFQSSPIAARPSNVALQILNAERRTLSVGSVAHRLQQGKQQDR